MYHTQFNPPPEYKYLFKWIQAADNCFSYTWLRKRPTVIYGHDKFILIRLEDGEILEKDGGFIVAIRERAEETAKHYGWIPNKFELIAHAAIEHYE